MVGVFSVVCKQPQFPNAFTFFFLYDWLGSFTQEGTDWTGSKTFLTEKFAVVPVDERMFTPSLNIDWTWIH